MKTIAWFMRNLLLLINHFSLFTFTIYIRTRDLISILIILVISSKCIIRCHISCPIQILQSQFHFADFQLVDFTQLLKLFTGDLFSDFLGFHFQLQLTQSQIHFFLFLKRIHFRRNGCPRQLARTKGRGYLWFGFGKCTGGWFQTRMNDGIRVR